MSVISAAAGLAVLMIALFAWLRADMGRMEARLAARGEEREARLIAHIEKGDADLAARIDGVETQLTGRIGGLEQSNIDLRERMARIEGMLDGLRDSIAGRDRRDAA